MSYFRYDWRMFWVLFYFHAFVSIFSTGLWMLLVVCCLLVAVDIKGPQGCLAESDYIYTCFVSLPFSVFLISLVSI